MNKRHGKADLRTREERLMEALRERPELMDRFEAILALTDSQEGALRTADEVEELLVEEVRRLGSHAMHQWAQGAEERAARELTKEHPHAGLRKKKS